MGNLTGGSKQALKKNNFFFEGGGEANDKQNLRYERKKKPVYSVHFAFDNKAIAKTQKNYKVLSSNSFYLSFFSHGRLSGCVGVRTSFITPCDDIRAYGTYEVHFLMPSSL